MVFNCAICRELLSVLLPERGIKITCCGHLYHLDCILNWLERNHTCPVCRETLLEDGLFDVYASGDEQNNTHLDSNSPAHALKDELNNFSDENRNLKKELTEMREKYNENQSALQSLELQLEKMTLEKQDLELKLTSMDEQKKEILDERNELELNLDSILIENNEICNKIKENEGELKLALSYSEIEKKNNELTSAYKKIESLERLKKTLSLQIISYKSENQLNKCDICKELVTSVEVDNSTKPSELKIELRQSPTKNKAGSSIQSNTRPSELENECHNQETLGELSQNRLFKMKMKDRNGTSEISDC